MRKDYPATLLMQSVPECNIFLTTVMLNAFGQEICPCSNLEPAYSLVEQYLSQAWACVRSM